MEGWHITNGSQQSRAMQDDIAVLMASMRLVVELNPILREKDR